MLPFPEITIYDLPEVVLLKTGNDPVLYVVGDMIAEGVDLNLMTGIYITP